MKQKFGSAEGAPTKRSDPGPHTVPPPPGTRTWGSRKKAAVILCIRSGLITREEAYAAYSLSPEELAAPRGRLRLIGAVIER